MRHLLSMFAGTVLALAAFAGSAGEAPRYAEVRAEQPLSFPRDHGAHPEFRTEWWYITGWLEGADRRASGFQLTFFRFKPEVDDANPSAFAPKQVLFAHAALSDRAAGRLLHDARVARAGFGLAEAATHDTDIVLGGWTLKRTADGRFTARLPARGFTLDLNFTPTQPVLPQGEKGYSRKGPLPSRASHYYSLPHLQVSGSVTRDGRREIVRGSAWLDREWSSSYLDPNAAGWDWIGVNLDGGAALMAFQIRDRNGGAFWAGGSLRDANGTTTTLGKDDIRFETVRSWRSPRTNTVYPVARVLSLRLPRGETRLHITPLFDDQELDSRQSGGPVYWEGAVQVDGAFRGRGYLELTGYFEPLRM